MIIITKPFDEDELVRKINTNLKHTDIKQNTSEPLSFKFGKFEYNHVNLSLKVNGKKSRITWKESEVLCMLLQSKNNIVRREDILVKV